MLVGLPHFFGISEVEDSTPEPWGLRAEFLAVKYKVEVAQVIPESCQEHEESLVNMGHEAPDKSPDHGQISRTTVQHRISRKSLIWCPRAWSRLGVR